MVYPNTKARRIEPDGLSGRCDPVFFANSTHASHSSLAPLGFIGQGPAVESLAFGLTQNTDGYNVVVITPDDTSRLSVLRQTIQQILKEHPLPYELHDYCYVYNFDTPECPRLVILPAGNGKIFKQSILDLFQKLLKQIPEALLSNEVTARIQEMQYECEAHIAQAILRFSATILGYNLTVFQYPDISGEGSAGSVFEIVSIEPVIDRETLQPILNDAGEPMVIRGKLDEWVRNINITEEQRIQRHQLAMQLSQRFQEVKGLTIQLREQYRKRIEEYREKIAADILEKVIESCLPQSLNASDSEIAGYITALRKYILNHLTEFMNRESSKLGDIADQEIPVTFYIKVYVGNDPMHAHQLIVEPTDFTSARFMGTFNPERTPNGTSVVSHTRMIAGFLAQANGGILLINGNALFRSPRGASIWQYLVKTLQQKAIVLEEDMSGFNTLLDIPNTTNFRPEPIPFQAKVVLLVDRNIYYRVLLAQVSDQMNTLFRVQAELNNTAPRSTDNYAMYADFIEECRKKEGLLLLDATAMARIVEYSARLSGDVEDFSLDLREIKAICIEANRVALDANATAITGEHVQLGVQRKRGRTSLTRNKMLQQIERGTLIVRTEGEATMRGNGLAVYKTADDQFGMPMTVTSLKFYNPNFTVLFLDSQAKATGKSFEKAAGTIEALLRARYGMHRSFPVGISISFEQIYVGIDGDSASVIEWLVAMSAIGDIKLHQNFAITGSLSQLGEVQPIGGVNEKIEGFFDVCAIRGLKGQSVLIPELNVRNLALRPDVVRACERGEFNVLAYSTPEQAMEFASGLPMDEVDKINNAAIEDAIARAKEHIDATKEGGK